MKRFIKRKILQQGNNICKRTNMYIISTNMLVNIAGFTLYLNTTATKIRIHEWNTSIIDILAYSIRTSHSLWRWVVKKCQSMPILDFNCSLRRRHYETFGVRRRLVIELQNIYILHVIVEMITRRKFSNICLQTFFRHFYLSSIKLHFRL